MNAPAAPAEAHDPQVVAADPAASAFVTANAGSGKTKTLVDRVARLLLHDAPPEAILCVTYTKAAAAEMQRRLFQQLGGWSMMSDGDLAGQLAAIGEHTDSSSKARRLFARALETPGGLKIQTLHAFCEKLLRRFPLEAGISPGFTVLDDAAASEISERARAVVARAAMAGQPVVSEAYARFAATLDFQAFERMFTAFEDKREAISAYVNGCGGLEGLPAAVAKTFGLERLESAESVQAAAVTPPALDLALWRAGAAALSTSGVRDQKCAAQMAAVIEAAEREDADFDLALRVFCTADGSPAKWVETAKAVRAQPELQRRLLGEQERLMTAADLARSARVAEDTVHALTLAWVYARAFGEAKAARGVLDFTDLVARTQRLLSESEGAAWVLYKLDGGIDHVLLDEAQDTAPPQWDILNALTAEFFAGAGVRGMDHHSPGASSKPLERTVFVVGDEKQSIYSFQGAAPERLSQELRRYQRAALEAQRPFASVPLLASWRSTPEVLSFVDAVFEPLQRRAALQPRGPEVQGEPALIRHIANRTRDQGTIDLWPLEREEPVEDRRAWDEPLDAEQARGAYRRLAEKIAAEIKALVERGEQVHDRETHLRRPAGYGDVLILVRKRRAMFQELLRALKRRDVPVAGADRLILSEHPVFEDLLALARILLFPNDDLNLAAVLRSPLCDVDESSLYDLARCRETSLWVALHRRAEERSEWLAARRLFDWAAGEAGRAPFELFSRLLTRLDGAGRSVRQRFLTRLGPEAGDALDEFLSQALAAEARGVLDLQRFAHGLSRLNLTVKREMDEPRGEVRIMTAHSAKGLEAPIVFLPETVSGGAVQGSPLLETEDGAFLWCASKSGDCNASGLIRALRAQKEEHEGLRLLYVALTRARDRVVIAGRINARSDPDKLKGWWAPMCVAFDHPAIAERVRKVEVAGMTVRRFGAEPVSMLSAEAGERQPRAVLPAWTQGLAPPESARSAHASPSTVDEEVRGVSPSPLSHSGGLGRFRRGNLIHRLLQLLPDLPPDAREPGAFQLLDKEGDLSPEQRGEMAAAALAVLNDPRFDAVFAPGSRAEAAIAGRAPELPTGLRISGRVDRMMVAPDRVLVVDFKTNRPSPARVEAADPAYLTQMAVYVAVLRAVYPDRRVEAALVWTDGPKLMPIPETLIKASLVRLQEGA